MERMWVEVGNFGELWLVCGEHDHTKARSEISEEAPTRGKNFLASPRSIHIQATSDGEKETAGVGSLRWQSSKTKRE
jgi:hypothetical protein